VRAWARVCVSVARVVSLVPSTKGSQLPTSLELSLRRTPHRLESFEIIDFSQLAHVMGLRCCLASGDEGSGLGWMNGVQGLQLNWSPPRPLYCLARWLSGAGYRTVYVFLAGFACLSRPLCSALNARRNSSCAAFAAVSWLLAGLLLASPSPFLLFCSGAFKAFCPPAARQRSSFIFSFSHYLQSVHNPPPHLSPIFLCLSASFLLSGALLFLALWPALPSVRRAHLPP